MDNLKISDILGNFPTDKPYRLIDVSSIRKFKNAFSLNLVFQVINENFEEPFDAKKLMFFKPTKMVRKEFNVAYSRLLVIGSIWRNYKNSPIFLPNYLKSYSINSNFIDNSEIKSGKIATFIDEKFIPSVFERNETDTGFNIVPRESEIIMYNLSKPLVYNKRNSMSPEASQLSFDKMPWKGEDESPENHFVAFYSYEIYRYFYTGTALSELNERLLYMPILNDLKRENEVYDPVKSVAQKDPISYPVYFRKHNDALSLTTIGNFIYQKNFRKQFQKISNSLNENSVSEFDVLECLPILTFENLRVKAKPVKRKIDGKWGLLVMQIESCTNYTSLKYTPVIPIPEQSEQSPKRPRAGSNSSGQNNKSNNEPKLEPKINNSGTTSPNSTPAKVEEFGLEYLFEPNQDLTQESAIYEHYNADGTKYYNKKNNSKEIGPPGANPENTGGDVITIKVNPTDHFSLFPRIMSGIVKYLRNAKIVVNLSFLNEQLIFENDLCLIDDGKLKFVKKPNNWFIYVAKLEIGEGKNKRNYFLFAKRQKFKSETQARNWLYFSTSMPNEIKLQSALNHYLYFPSLENKLSTEVLWKRLLRLNHKGSEPVKQDGKIITHTQVDIEIAVQNHVEKIGKQLISYIKPKKS